MEAFTLDTSGSVGPYYLDERTPGFVIGGSHVSHVSWSDLDAFAQGYIEASARDWPFLPRSDGGQRQPAFSDLAPETLAGIIADCAAFERSHPSAVWAAKMRTDARHFGRKFWRERQAAHFPRLWPPLTPYLGDDGRVYLRESGK